MWEFLNITVIESSQGPLQFNPKAPYIPSVSTGPHFEKLPCSCFILFSKRIVLLALRKKALGAGGQCLIAFSFLEASRDVATDVPWHPDTFMDVYGARAQKGIQNRLRPNGPQVPAKFSAIVHPRVLLVGAPLQCR